MRRPLAMWACALLLAACQPSTPASSPTAPAPTGTERAAQPTVAPAGLFFDDFDVMDAQRGWAWKGISQLYRTDDGGTTWHEIHLQGKRLVSGASFLSGEEAWLPGVAEADQKQAIYHTSDGGMTWSQLGSLPGPNLELHFLDESSGWALNGIGAAGNVFYQLYRTTDEGTTWMHIPAAGAAGTDQGPMAGDIHVATGGSVSFSAPETIWVAQASGVPTSLASMSVSRDGGTSWRDVNVPVPEGILKDAPFVRALAPQFVNRQDAFLPVQLGFSMVFFVSHDAGNSWSPLPPRIRTDGQIMPMIQFVNPSDGFVVCGWELCATQDGGMTWQRIKTPFPFGQPMGQKEFVTRVDFVDAQTGWAILSGQQGASALLQTTDGGRTWIRLSPRLGF